MSRTIMNPSKNYLRLVFQRLDQIKLPHRLRGGFIENSLNYVRNVGLDYVAVYRETVQDIRRRPFKSTIIFGALFSGAYLIKHNPTEEDFHVQLIDSNNRLSRVPESLRNKTSLEHIHELFQVNNKELLRHQSLGLFSIIYRTEYSPENDLYQAQCKYLQPSWREKFNNIVDVGILDRYWWMHLKMKDYDVNTDEWNNQPVC